MLKKLQKKDNPGYTSLFRSAPKLNGWLALNHPTGFRRNPIRCFWIINKQNITTMVELIQNVGGRVGVKDDNLSQHYRMNNQKCIILCQTREKIKVRIHLKIFKSTFTTDSDQPNFKCITPLEKNFQQEKGWTLSKWHGPLSRGRSCST